MPTTEQKAKRVEEFGSSQKDTGSARVQIALLTDRINELTAHLKTHQKDLHSERGLTVLVGKRRRLLDYLERTDAGAYRELVKKLTLRK